MTDVPSLSYRQVVKALQRAGFVVVRQGGEVTSDSRKGLVSNCLN